MDSREVREALLASLDLAFDRRSWHGPNLKGAIRSVDPASASWRPQPGRHNIWEIVVHAAYWKYVARRRLTGDRRGSFPLKGSDWFERPQDPSRTAWTSDLRILEEQHELLRRAVERLSPRELRMPVGRSLDAFELIQGVAFHDIYHAGQIRLLRRLIQSEQEMS